MKTNESNVDRILRAVAGIFLLVIYFTNVVSGTFGIITLVVAALLLITAAVGFCPLYTLLKINTKKA